MTEKSPIKILFVCHGNICRSPMAEFVMKAKVEAAGLADRFEIASAATSAEELGEPVYPRTRKLLQKHGISCAGKTARRLTQRDYAYYDLLIAMDKGNIWEMGLIYKSDPDKKIKMLLDYTDQPGEIDDPWYTGEFERTWEEVNRGCDALLKALSSN